MSQSIVKPIQTAAVVHLPSSEASLWTPDQLKLITDVVAKGATPDELKLFLYRCNKMGLDPLKAGQIFFIKYGNSPGTIVVGIEGFRSRASKTGKLRGIKRGVLRDEAGVCTGAWAKVRRSDWDEPAEAEVSLAEYTTGKNNWATKPETMIQKVAEAAALRMAFPDELGDAYSPEEMDKTALEPRPNPIYCDQPGPEDGVVLPPSEYRITFGQWGRKSIDEILRDPKIGPHRVAEYIEYLERPEQVTKRQTDKPHLIPLVAEFIERASDAIAFMEQEMAKELGSER